MLDGIGAGGYQQILIVRVFRIVTVVRGTIQRAAGRAQLVQEIEAGHRFLFLIAVPHEEVRSSYNRRPGRRHRDPNDCQLRPSRVRYKNDSSDCCLRDWRTWCRC